MEKKTCTCTIITTEANEAVKPIHDRMPVILPRDKEDVWINPATRRQGNTSRVLKPYLAEEMEAYEVSARVNSPQYNTASNIEPFWPTTQPVSHGKG